ncbi:Acyl-CoA dehydrogenase [Sterolibacterium denitrificans]|uniref:Acyl-CoA dehydrogenase n=1 Tax=Sterolibacterium denitrificans TaxID=157592 RepID=A0A7Z7HSP5_9PROT|nr:acyl-CoA dehydrogenase family protein [Sterolibacterium denitrificans]SMB25627.1 Acyl-CoA dehydrogenase [Sterolibacterium denitrificans]
MANKPNAVGTALGTLSRLADSSFMRRHKLNKAAEKAVYLSTRTGFQAIAQARKLFKPAKPQGGASRLALPGHTTELFDCNISEEQQMMKDSVAQFAGDVLRPQAHGADESCACPADLHARAQELGLMMFAVPEAHGGDASEAALLTNVLVAEALGKGDMSQALAILAPLSVANALTRWGTAEQQATYLPPFAANEPLLATLAINEARPLFNPLEPALTATPGDDGWRLDGIKTQVPLAARSALWLVSAMTGNGPRIFIVEAGTPGVGVRAAGSMGLHAAELGDLNFDNVRLPKSALLGDETFDYAQFIDCGTLGWCALAIGCAEAVLDYVIPYCNEREAFGEPISHRQAVAFMIANIAIELESMRMLTYRAANRADLGLPWHREAFLARTLTQEKAMEIGSNGVQLLGGHGFTKEHPVERWYRDLRAVAVLHGGLHL